MAGMCTDTISIRYVTVREHKNTADEYEYEYEYCTVPCPIKHVFAYEYSYEYSCLQSKP